MTKQVKRGDNGHTKRYWRGMEPIKCQFCASRLGITFYDAKTKAEEWWMMCSLCFLSHGVGTGLGQGQKYEKQPDGRWLKTEG